MRFNIFAIVWCISLSASLWANACTTTGNSTLWSSPSAWMNCGGTIPQPGDTVAVKHVIHADIAASPIVFGTSQLDTATAVPKTFALTVTYPAGLTIDANVSFNVRGSVSWNGQSSPPRYATLDMDPGSSWTFDNTQQPTAVYRNLGMNWISILRATGTAASHVSLYGKPPTTVCSNCVPAMWYTESTSVGAKYSDAIGLNMQYVDFYDFGQYPNYKSIYYFCAQGKNRSRPFRLFAVNFYRCVGMAPASTGGGGGFPCEYIDYSLTYVRSLNTPIPSSVYPATTPTGYWGFLGTYGVSTPFAGNDRSITYSYFDRGWLQNALGHHFVGFLNLQYLVLDGNFDGGDWSGGGSIHNDHLLLREEKHNSSGLTNPFGSHDLSYMLFVLDGTNNVHAGWFDANGAPHGWDHFVFQYGDRYPADSEVEGWGNWNYCLFLPDAAAPQWAWGDMNHGHGPPRDSSVAVHYNHCVIAGGAAYWVPNDPNLSKPPGNPNCWIGSIYYGEGSSPPATGVVNTVSIQNSILWNPNPPGLNCKGSPVMVHGTTDTVGIPGQTGGVIANWLDPVNTNHNDVWNYNRATRWLTSAYSVCQPDGMQCSNNGTWYDVPTNGTVPGAGDLNVAPQFKWQTLGMTAPGVLDWARIRFGADTTTQPDPTKYTFRAAFAVFGQADPTDLATLNGLKGRIDDFFAWIYDMWSSTNSALHGAANDGTDIGVGKSQP